MKRNLTYFVDIGRLYFMLKPNNSLEEGSRISSLILSVEDVIKFVKEEQKKLTVKWFREKFGDTFTIEPNDIDQLPKLIEQHSHCPDGIPALF